MSKHAIREPQLRQTGIRRTTRAYKADGSKAEQDVPLYRQVWTDTSKYKTKPAGKR